MSSDKVSVADVQRGVNPRRQPIPGATPFVPRVDPAAPQFVVVADSYFDGKDHPKGSVVSSSLPNKEGLPSPGLALKPLDWGDKPWPPADYAKRKREQEAKARRDWIRDMASRF